MSRTLQELAEEAIQIQDACNLSGLVHAWSRAIADLREHWENKTIPCTCTTEFNRHPINRLWASKVHDLTQMGLSDIDAYGTAYEACKLLMKEKPCQKS